MTQIPLSHTRNVLFGSSPAPSAASPLHFTPIGYPHQNLFGQNETTLPQQQAPLQYYESTPFQEISPNLLLMAPNPTEIRVNWRIAFTSGGFEGEPPLLEELGINFSHIRLKTFAVLNPLSPISTEIMGDADLAGPLLFCFLFGCLLLVAGKPHFPYIYGVATLGCVSIYALLNLMSSLGITWSATASVLGYCLLPMVLLSLIGIVFNLSTSSLGILLSVVAVLWCSHAASNMFAAVLQINDKRPLIAYPIVLLYAIFGLMAVY